MYFLNNLMEIWDNSKSYFPYFAETPFLILAPAMGSFPAWSYPYPSTNIFYCYKKEVSVGGGEVGSVVAKENSLISRFHDFILVVKKFLFSDMILMPEFD